MQSKPQNPPSRHHFIPQFLLAEWTDGDALLRYWRNRLGEIECSPASPKSVCVERDLYKTIGFPPEHAQQMETLFMQVVDDGAAKVHAQLLSGEIASLSDAQCSDWGRFVMSLWFRTPLDMRGLRDAVSALASPQGGKAMVNGDHVQLPPVAVSALQMEILRTVIDDAERGRAFINMDWRVITTTNRREFFVSDWPLDVPVSFAWLGDRSSYVTVPIAPDKLFVAAGSRALGDRIAALPERELITRQNQSTVGHAQNFVGARRPQAADFIRANFGGRARHSVTGSIAEQYKGSAPPA